MENFYSVIRKILSSKYKGDFNRTLINDLDSGTKIEVDLYITGDDADEFIYLVCKEFEINGDNFTFGKYFGGESESTDVLTPILRFFFRKNKRIPLKKEERHHLTLGDLEYCVRRGVLSDDEIKNAGTEANGKL